MVHEGQALGQKVALLSQGTPAAASPPASAPAVVPDPLLQHLHTLASKVDACMAGYMGVHQKLTLYNSSNQKSFQSAQNQCLAQARDIASLKSANESLGAQNTKFTDQVAELGRVLNFFITQTSQTSQLVAQSQSQGQAFQGRVLGMEKGMAQVITQVGGWGMRCSNRKHPCHPFLLW